MIKTFEQFVYDMYSTSVNEAYQSSKLRNIIKQHGKPKWEHEYKMLYDIKDDEIVDVVSSRNEYYKQRLLPSKHNTPDVTTYEITNDNGGVKP